MGAMCRAMKIKSGKRLRLTRRSYLLVEGICKGFHITTVTHWFSRIFINDGSSINVLFKQTFNVMRVSTKELSPCPMQIHEFIEESVMSKRSTEM